MAIIGTVSGNGATIQISAVEDGFGNTTFTIEVVSGFADLRGFFFDYTGDAIALAGGSQAYDSDGTALAKAVTASSLGTSGDGDDITKVGSNDNNMNGTGETYDAGLQFGGSGGMSDKGANDDVQKITFTINNLSLSEIDGLSFGIRALSVGATEDTRADSVKLTGTFEVPDPGNPPANDFPEWPQDISHIVLYFEQDAGDTKPQFPPPGPEGDGDGFYVVKIDNVTGDAPQDLDAWIADALAKLDLADSNIDATSDLLGVVIKGGTQDTQFYAYGAHNLNGDAPDTIPAGAPEITTPPSQGDVDGPLIDATYDYATLLGVGP